MISPFPRTNFRAGQTIIETVVAIFMLTTGITATIGLANYALANSTSITKQIVATGLAREGLEAVKAMRDTNWLQDSLSSDCYDFFDSQDSGGECYHDWLTQEFDISSPLTSNNRLVLASPSDGQPYYALDNVNPGVGNQDKYGLNFNSATSSPSFAGFYTQPTGGVENGIPDPEGTRYYRDIVITQSVLSPYDKPNLSKVQVVSRVWWTDRKCPASKSWPGMGKCSLELTTYLTNWKDY